MSASISPGRDTAPLACVSTQQQMFFLWLKPEGLLHDVLQAAFPDLWRPTHNQIHKLYWMPAGMPAIRQSLNAALARVPPAGQCVAAQALATQLSKVSNNMDRWQVTLSLLRRALGLPQQSAEGVDSQVTLPHSMLTAHLVAKLSFSHGTALAAPMQLPEHVLAAATHANCCLDP